MGATRSLFCRALLVLTALVYACNATADNPAQGSDLHVLSRVHFNTNVSDFARSRQFYGLLGFTTVSGFPDTNTQAMARAIGIATPTTYDGSAGGEAGGYKLHGELISLSSFGGAMIDLIEFDIPRNEAPPYPALNRLGMVKSTLYTTHLDADVAYLAQAGVTPLAASARDASGRFVHLTDPDGTFIELREVADSSVEPRTEPPHVYALASFTINVSDLERSTAWYARMGYTVVSTELVTYDESQSTALGMPFSADAPPEVRVAQLVHQGDGSALELMQWLHPFDPTAPYPIPVNHIGMHRMAFLTTDIDADTHALQASGVKFISPVTPCCSGADSWGSIVAFYDPDGVVVELVEQPVMGRFVQFMQWLSRLFG